jgi:hypothetical protein
MQETTILCCFGLDHYVKVDSTNIDKPALRRLLKDQYGLCAATLSFVPQGEESYGYILETSAQTRYFVNVYEHPSEGES